MSTCPRKKIIVFIVSNWRSIHYDAEGWTYTKRKIEMIKLAEL